MEFNHKTVFLVVINLQHEVASKARMANTVTITAGELVREVEEATQATAKGTP